MAQFSIIPNPLKEEATISIDNSYTISNGTLTIHSILGKKVNSKTFVTNTLKIKKGNLAPGIYICKLYNNEVFIGSQKLIVE
jgi:hypothetical protein